MPRTTMEISYSCGRGAAKSSVDQYLSGKGYKQTPGRNGKIVWRKKTRDQSNTIEHIQAEYGDGVIKISAWVTGLTVGQDRKPTGEESLDGLQRIPAKRQVKKDLKEIRKLFDA